MKEIITILSNYYSIIAKLMSDQTENSITYKVNIALIQLTGFVISLLQEGAFGFFLSIIAKKLKLSNTKEQDSYSKLLVLVQNFLRELYVANDKYEADSNQQNDELLKVLSYMQHGLEEILAVINTNNSLFLMPFKHQIIAFLKKRNLFLFSISLMRKQNLDNLDAIHLYQHLAYLKLLKPICNNQLHTAFDLTHAESRLNRIYIEMQLAIENSSTVYFFRFNNNQGVFINFITWQNIIIDLKIIVNNIQSYVPVSLLDNFKSKLVEFEQKYLQEYLVLVSTNDRDKKWLLKAMTDIKRLEANLIIAEQEHCHPFFDTSNNQAILKLVTIQKNNMQKFLDLTRVLYELPFMIEIDNQFIIGVNEFFQQHFIITILSNLMSTVRDLLIYIYEQSECKKHPLKNIFMTIFVQNCPDKNKEDLFETVISLAIKKVLKLPNEGGDVLQNNASMGHELSTT